MSKKSLGQRTIDLASPKTSLIALVGLVGVFAFTQVTLGEIKRQHQQVLGERDTRYGSKKQEERRVKIPTQFVTTPTKTTAHTTETTSTTESTVSTNSQDTSGSNVVTNQTTPTPTDTKTNETQADSTPTPNTTDTTNTEQNTVIINSGGTVTRMERNTNGEVKRVEPTRKVEVKRTPIPAAVVKQVEQQTGLNLTTDDLKIFYEKQGDKVVAKGEKADGTKVELNSDVLSKINQRLAENNIQIATTSGDRFMLQRASISAETKLPISLNLANNSLIVTTPNGIKTVTILPDQAVQNMLRNAKVNVVNDIQLVDDNGAPTYQISSETNKKLFGFIPVTVKKKVSVSAENGEIVGNQESPLGWLFDKLSK